MSKKGKFSGNTKNSRKKGNKTRVVLITLIVILSIILAVMVAGLIYVENLFGAINRPSDNATLSSSEIAALHNSEAGLDIGDADAETMPKELDIITDSSQLIGDSDDIINILLLGQDTRNAAQKGLVDTMIVCTINKQTNNLVMTSFLRDMYVQIQSNKGGYYFQRINTTYPVGGIDMVYRTLEQNFGVSVDHYIEIDFAGFKDIVDVLGGLDIELTKAEAKHINDQNGWGTKLTEGMNHLNGEESLEYARVRKIDNDFNRTNRQRIVLNKLFEKVKNMNLTDANDLIKTVLPMISTDMTNSEITKYVVELLPLLPKLEIISQAIPAGSSVDDGYYYYADKGTEEQPMYVIIPNLEKNRELLRNTIGVEAVG